MEMKKCSMCRQLKKLDEYSLCKRARDGRQHWCKKCCNKKRLEYYYKDPQSVRDNVKKHQKRNKEFLKQYLSEHPCVDCGYSDIRALDFDHVRGVKLSEVTTMAAGAFSLEKIKNEIAKCEVRCANCHRIRHSKGR